jgi:SAM-dependent methyltransferase
MTIWDQQFAGSAFKYGTQPNAFLVEQAGRIAARGQVLLPGDGEGRNSVWLAKQGFSVTAMDNSVVGLEKARELAHAQGVSIQTVHADLQHWVPESCSADAVVLIYVHLPSMVRAVAMPRLMRALRPGGVMVLEAFHPRQLGLPSGGPKIPDMLYTLELLRGDLSQLEDPGLHELLGWEGPVTLDEGPGHQGPAYVTRWVLQRDAVPTP